MGAEFRQGLVMERTRELERVVRRPRHQPRGRATLPASVVIVLRLETVHDRSGLQRLAALEGRPVPSGPCVLAEVGGTVVAALPIDGGALIADPFALTKDLMPLLEVRARQLTARGRWKTFRAAVRKLAPDA